MDSNCTAHKSPFVGFCFSCNSGLCIECMFDHQEFKDHIIEKLTKLKERIKSEYLPILKTFKDEQALLEKQKGTKGEKDGGKDEQLKNLLATLEEFKQRVLSMVESHFEEVKGDLVQRSLFADGPSKGSSYDLTDKIKTLEGLLQGIQSDDKVINSLQQLVKQDWAKEVANLPSKQSKPTGTSTVDLVIDDSNIERIHNLLICSALVVSDKSKVNLNLSPPIPTNCAWLPWFIENTRQGLLYNVRTKDIQKGELQNDKNFSIPPNSRFICSHDGNIYLLGGLVNGKCSSSLYCFDPKKWAFVERKPMIMGRIGHAVCSFSWNKEIHLFVAGGKGEDGKRMVYVEKYNTQRDEWSTAPPLNIPRSGACLSQLNGSVYCFGGINQNGMIDDTIEMLNLLKNIWTPIKLKNPSNFLPLIECSAVQINQNQILILGGSSILTAKGDIEALRSMIVFDGQEETILNMSGTANLVSTPHNMGDATLLIHEQTLWGFAKVLREKNMMIPTNRLLLRMSNTKCFIENMVDLSLA